MAVARLGAEIAFGYSTRADVLIKRYISASNRGHVNPKMITFRKDLHSQEIGALPPCIEVELPLRGIVHGLLCHKKAFKNATLIFRDNPDPIVPDYQFNAILPSSGVFSTAFLTRPMTSFLRGSSGMKMGRVVSR